MGYYFARDKTPEYRSATLASAATTSTIWSPRTGNKWVVDSLTIAANLGAVIKFYKGTTTSGPDLIVTFVVGGSDYISLNAIIDGSATTNYLYATTDTGSTGGQYVFATGFEDTIADVAHEPGV